MKKKDIRIDHYAQDIFELNCTFVYKVEKKVPYHTHWGDCVMRGSGEYEDVEKDGGYNVMRYPTAFTFYVDILTATNRLCGTNYKVSEEDIKLADSYRNKTVAWDSDYVEIGWTLEKCWTGEYELTHKYRYENEPDLGLLKEGYDEDWAEDELIELCDALVKWRNSNPYEIVKKALGELWSEYDEIGIEYEKDERYA